MEYAATGLQARLDEHRRALCAAASANEFLDLASLDDLHIRVRGEIDRWAELSSDQRDTLERAVDYLVRLDDAEDDAASPIGLEDDREVVDAAIREIRAGGTDSGSPTT